MKVGKHIDIGYFNTKLKVRSKVAKKRNIINKIEAWKLGKEYYDGKRINGYGCFKYDGRWLKLLPAILKNYKITKKSKFLDLGCKKGFLLKDLNKLVPGINSIYMQSLGDVIKTLKEINRISKKSYIVLASGENEKEIYKFYKWTLIGTSIQLKKDWIRLFKKVGYKGDYYFSSSKSLGI